MKNGEPVVLLHIRDSLMRILEYAEVEEPEFMKDARTQDAVLRRLEIVGEAVKRLPESFRNQHPHVPWKRIAAFRDVAIHHYDRVDLDRVWALVEDDVPTLLRQIKEILKGLGETR